MNTIFKVWLLLILLAVQSRAATVSPLGQDSLETLMSCRLFDPVKRQEFAKIYFNPSISKKITVTSSSKSVPATLTYADKNLTMTFAESVQVVGLRDDLAINAYTSAPVVIYPPNNKPAIVLKFDCQIVNYQAIRIWDNIEVANEKIKMDSIATSPVSSGQIIVRPKMSTKSSVAQNVQSVSSDTASK